MNRQEFLKKSSIFALGAPFLSTLLSSCNSTEPLFTNLSTNFSGKVLIIGAGAAGLTAGYILNRYNIDFEIVEASDRYGGRVKEVANFADFPIDLGAEWIHTNPRILSEILSDSSIDAQIETIVYQPQTVYMWKNGELKKRNIFSNFYSEHKFKNTTWFSYFEEFIVPSIFDKIRLNSPIHAIDYSGEKPIAQNVNGETFEADKVLITVPTSILQKEYIQFTPNLPEEKKAAIDFVNMPNGAIKVFIEFSERFYPDIIYDGGAGDFLDGGEGEKVFYDAAFRKGASRHVFALFCVGDKAEVYADLETNDAIIEHVLDELDAMFDGKAREFYLKHVIQHWAKEAFIQGSYTHNYDADNQAILRRAVDEKLYFAGEAYAENWATVHGAAESAYAAIEQMLST